jgi:AraC-like DNA-binding protein
VTSALFRTRDVPREDRFAYWRELADRSHVPTILESDHTGDWDASMSVRSIGAIKISRQHHPPLVARRPPRMIRQADPEYLYLIAPTRGRLVAQQFDRTADHGPESFVILDSSRPVTTATPTESSHLTLHLPRSVLLARRRVENLLARPIGASHGVGASLILLLRELADNDRTHPVTVLTQLTQAVIDLVVAIQLMASGDAAAIATESRNHVRRVAVLAYIEANLSDPSLTLSRIAKAHNISLRLLDRLFQEMETTPARWIREQRLQRCRRDLADPAQAATPVAVIGARWGIPDPVTFSRAFSRAYGMPPGEYRRHFAVPLA